MSLYKVHQTYLLAENLLLDGFHLLRTLNLERRAHHPLQRRPGLDPLPEELVSEGGRSLRHSEHRPHVEEVMAGQQAGCLRREIANAETGTSHGQHFLVP